MQAEHKIDFTKPQTAYSRWGNWVHSNHKPDWEKEAALRTEVKDNAPAETRREYFDYIKNKYKIDLNKPQVWPLVNFNDHTSLLKIKAYNDARNSGELESERRVQFIRNAPAETGEINPETVAAEATPRPATLWLPKTGAAEATPRQATLQHENPAPNESYLQRLYNPVNYGGGRCTRRKKSKKTRKMQAGVKRPSKKLGRIV